MILLGPCVENVFGASQGVCLCVWDGVRFSSNVAQDLIFLFFFFSVLICCSEAIRKHRAR